MRGYPVYRMDLADNTVLRVGTILELRKSRRSMNRVGLVKLARKLFARHPDDIVYVGFESTMERADSFHEAARAESAG